MEEEKKPDQIPVWATDLIKNQEEQNKVIERLRLENEMLKDLAGQNKIKGWEESKRDVSTKFAHFKIWKGKLIKAWKEMDFSEFNPKGETGRDEKQIMTVIFLDDSEERLNYMDVVNIKELVNAKLLSRGTLPESECMLELEDGTVFKTQVKFLNA